MKVKKITKQELEGNTYLIAQAVNHNAEVLESALSRIKKLEKSMAKEEPVGKPLEIEEFKNAYIQVAKERDIAIEQLNELGYSLGEKIRPCEKQDVDAYIAIREKALEYTFGKAIAEVDRQEKWLAQAGYNAYNVSVAFGAIKHALEK